MAGYFILHTRWHSFDHLREYQRGAQESFKEFGAEPIVYDVDTEVVEGESAFPATVILKFESLEKAKAWYHSPTYQAVIGLRLQSSEGVARFAETLHRH